MQYTIAPTTRFLVLALSSRAARTKEQISQAPFPSTLQNQPDSYRNCSGAYFNKTLQRFVLSVRLLLSAEQRSHVSSPSSQLSFCLDTTDNMAAMSDKRPTVPIVVRLTISRYNSPATVEAPLRLHFASRTVLETCIYLERATTLVAKEDKK